MTLSEIDASLYARIEAADARYGDFASTHEALGVALEEWNELGSAIHANDLDAIAHEALDLAAVMIRLAMSIPTGDAMRKRSVK